MKTDFKKRYGGSKADTAVAKSLNKEFGPVIKEHMQYIIDHADEIEKLLKVKAQVSEVKSIMLVNIDKAIARGENLTILTDKAEDFGTTFQEAGMYENKVVIWWNPFSLDPYIWLSFCQGFLTCTKYKLAYMFLHPVGVTSITYPILNHLILI